MEAKVTTNMKDETTTNANVNSHCDFILMDMNVYNEEDEEEGNDEEVPETKKEDPRINDSDREIKNNYQDPQPVKRKSKTKSKWNPIKNQQENNLEISTQKRYGLRNRKGISMREEDFHYFNDKPKIVQFTCDFCNDTFSCLNTLRKHITVHLKNPLECLNCLENFVHKEELKHHNCTKGPHKCEKCNKIFPQLYKLEIHMLKHNGIMYKCTKCGKSFPSQKLLDHHITSVNCSSTTKRCEHCNKLYRDNLNFKKHLQTHNNMKCNNCKMVFTDSLKFTQHCKDCKKQKTKYECDNCGCKFVRLVKLQIHILNVHHSINYQCDKCNCKFPSQEDWDLHVCKNDEPCVCKICNKVFAKRDYLKKHQYMHTSVLYKCKYCYCAFMKEKSYTRHVSKLNCSKSARKIKLAEFNYKKCRVCNEEFDSEENLIVHFNEFHPNDKPHQCFCCDMCLGSFSDLQSHIHQHNIQKYTCNLCGKPYTSQEGFRKHRLKHKGAEFKCKFCESEFLNESRFKFHVKTCKKNPESGYEPNPNKKPKKKDDRPKQSRQLHWESRIIMKRLRGDPKETENSIVPNFFDEPEPETNERGWFDNYYKTEEDDIAFGLKKDNDCETESENGDFNQPEEDVRKTETEESESESEIEDVEIDYNPKKCRICVLDFAQEYELLHHFIKTHPGRNAHKCPNCESEFPLFAQLKEHMKNHGIGIGIFNCDNCSKKFRSEKKMKTHNYLCKGKSDAVGAEIEDYCKRCDKKFQTKCGYRRHKQICKQKTVHAKETPEPIVDATPEPEPEPQQPETKTAYAGEPPLDSFPCRLCDKKFQYERGIVMHFKSEHPGHKPLICHVCNMHLADKLKEHLKTHGIGEEFICELCGKRFNQKFLSKIHEMWHQGIEFKCNNCKQKFLNKEKMDKHVGENRCSNRQSLMRLPCNVCGKSYRSKFGLSKHLITHTPKELRPVKNRMNCEFCGKWFENNNGLQRHRRIHTGERPFCCRFCPKAFAQEGNCKAHERIHTGESKTRRKKQANVEPVSVPPAHAPTMPAPPQPQPAVNFQPQISFSLCYNIDTNTIVH